MAVKTRTVESPSAVGALRGGVPAWLIGVALVGLGLPIATAAFSLNDRVQYWGKLVHAVDGLCICLVFGVLLLAWRDRESVDFTDELATLTTIFAGIAAGVIWKIAEFLLDWARYSDIQKSNAGTMTDFLGHDLGAILGAVLATHLYCNVVSAGQRSTLGAVSAWLVDGPSRVLNRHGFLLTIVAVLGIGLAIGVSWFAGRPMPGFDIP